MSRGGGGWGGHRGEGQSVAEWGEGATMGGYRSAHTVVGRHSQTRFALLLATAWLPLLLAYGRARSCLRECASLCRVGSEDVCVRACVCVCVCVCQRALSSAGHAGQHCCGHIPSWAWSDLYCVQPPYKCMYIDAATPLIQSCRSFFWEKQKTDRLKERLSAFQYTNEICKN